MSVLAEDEKIIKLSKKDISQCTRILTEAFIDDPLFKYVFTGKNRKKTIEYFLKFMLTASISLGELAIGIVKDSEIVGVALVEKPIGIHGIKLFTKPFFLVRLFLFFIIIPNKSLRLINEQVKHTNSVRPKKPHYYGQYLAVSPKHRKKGLATKLLNYIHGIADKDTQSVGMALDTENNNNLRLYNEHGYRLTSEWEYGDLIIYSMFRERNITE